MKGIRSKYQAWEQDRVKHAWKVYLKSIALAVGGGVCFGWITGRGAELCADRIVRPPFSPSDSTFLVVWLLLYFFMGISSARVYLKVNSMMRVYALKTYGWQLLFNWLWGIWFFNLQWYGFAFLWLLALVVQVAWMLAAFRELDALAARLQIPYLVWLFFAAFLNLSILVLNKR